MPDQQRATFAQNVVVQAWQPSRSCVASLALHGVLLVALFRGHSPIFVAPRSVLGGAKGTSITRLYWAPGSDQTESKWWSNASPVQGAAKTARAWKKAERTEPASRHELPSPEKDAPQASAAVANPAPPAGSVYGSLSEGASDGHEIRPALPALTSEPVVNAEDLRGAAEGNVVIEITIDEAGNIVNKVVVQSLGPRIDAKVLTALENWRFHPATRDGVPIPSRQDVVYHFKPR